LKTDLKVRTHRLTAAEWMKWLHPTPALGVAPRNYGYQWMKALPEQSERQLFGAPICFTFKKQGSEQVQSVSLVMIRSVFWSRNFVQVFAGCGIVRESILEKEWQELLAKLDSVDKMLIRTRG
jgi:menaquinone-specific isochorismate synthase